MADVQLTAVPRTVLGKKVRFLRRQGLLPANLYGQGHGSRPVQLPVADVLNVLRHGSANTLIDLQIEGDRRTQPVLIREMQVDPVTRRLLHVDFLQVSLTDPIEASVSLVFTGEAPAVKDLNGVLVHDLDSIVVSALPSDLPQSLSVDVSVLTDLDQSIYARDVALPPKVSLVTDPDALIAKVTPPRIRAEIEAEEAEAAAEAAEVAEESGAVAESD